MIKYHVAHYDSFDMQWTSSEYCEKEFLFSDLDRARNKCDEMNDKNSQSNKDCGEYWAVFHIQSGELIYK